MFTVVRYSAMRSFSTTALIETTSAPVIPRSVFAASCTAASAALAKLSGEEPMMVMTFATFAMQPPPLVAAVVRFHDHAVPGDRVVAVNHDRGIDRPIPVTLRPFAPPVLVCVGRRARLVASP